MYIIWGVIDNRPILSFQYEDGLTHSLVYEVCTSSKFKVMFHRIQKMVAGNKGKTKHNLRQSKLKFESKAAGLSVGFTSHPRSFFSSD